MVLVIVMRAMVRWTTLCDVVVVTMRAVVVRVVTVARMVMGCRDGVVGGGVVNSVIVARRGFVEIVLICPKVVGAR